MIPLTQNIDGVDKPLYVLRKASDKSIVSQRVTSNAIEGPPVVNADADLEFLPMMTDEPPIFDPNFQRVIRTEGPNEATGQWEITLTVEDKTKEEILKAVDDAARRQVPNVVPAQDFTENTIIALAAVINAGKFSYSPEEQTDADAVVAQAAKLLKNRLNRDAKKAEVEAGGKPDLGGGWEVATATVDVIPLKP